MLTNADNIAGPIIVKQIITKGIFVISMLFFGFVIFVGINWLIKSEIAWINHSKGINANPTKSLTEFIEWKDIFGFKEIKIQSQPILMIGLSNPEHWIEKETSSFRERLMKFNLDNYHPFLNISAAGLDISYKELNEKLDNYFEKFINEI